MACLRVVDVLKVATLGTYNIPDREDEGSEDSSRALLVDVAARKLDGTRRNSNVEIGFHGSGIAGVDSRRTELDCLNS